MSGRWLLVWGVCGVTNMIACFVLMALHVADGNYGAAIFNLICALVSAGWGGFFLGEWRAAR